ncbi:MAG: hypothetical protein WBN96_07215 [Gammaproteobacteria bacterium]
MSNNTLKKSLAVAMGASFAAAMAVSPVANADSNPFGMSNLSGGYMQIAEGKCGEGKCGEGKTKKEGKCGEGKCGEGKKAEGKCGEGKCGEGKMKKEGKCGGEKEDAE